MPGERSHRTAQENRKLGIPIGPETLGELRTLAQQYKFPYALEPVAATD